jgi:SAM-dependent methyltransferase
VKYIRHAKDYGETGWNQFFHEKGTQWRDKDYRFLAEVFDLSGLRGSLLDAGCALGDGQKYLYGLCPNVTEYHGCDFSNEAIDTCRRNPNLARTKFFRHDLQATFSSSFDNILCLQTLEHIPCPDRAFAHLLSRAREVLIVATPYKNRRPDENHLWSFDESDFKHLATCHAIGQNGLNIFWLCDKSKRGYAFKNSMPPSGIFSWRGMTRVRSAIRSFPQRLI